MNSPHVTQLIPIERVEKLIHLARGEKVLLDADLAVLYGVETKALNRAVQRNRNRFPQDFMFRLTADEAAALRCQIGTSNEGRGGRRYLPYAFTEQGVAVLSSVFFDAIRQLMTPQEKPRREIGFHAIPKAAGNPGKAKANRR